MIALKFSEDEIHSEDEVAQEMEDSECNDNSPNVSHDDADKTEQGKFARKDTKKIIT